MIKSFRHKGIEKLFISNDRSRVNSNHADKILRILDRLDASSDSHDMNLPGYRLHQLSGKQKGYWSMVVSGNWRIIFRFESKDVFDVEYLDYH